VAGGPRETKVAIVVGAAGIIGEAVSKRLRTEGLIVAGLDESVGADDELRAVELTDRLALVAAVEDVRRELGPVSVLVVAPHTCDAAPIGEMDRTRWESLLQAHLGVATSACAAVVPAMVEAGSGTVILMSSWLALAGIPGEAYQAAATGTLLSFTKGFAMEVAPTGVRVNCVAVGPTTSEPEQHVSRSGMGIRLQPGRQTSPDEVAETVVFLINDGDFYVGQVFEPFVGAVI
jgi:NAD(P)-dependent dehydrogenase (short-subunit alcohol dehydrogenase family)